MKRLFLYAFTGIVFGMAVAGFMSEPEYVTEKLELPERPKVVVDWGEPCQTSRTLVCKEWRKSREN